MTSKIRINLALLFIWNFLTVKQLTEDGIIIPLLSKLFASDRGRLIDSLPPRSRDHVDIPEVD